VANQDQPNIGLIAGIIGAVSAYLIPLITGIFTLGRTQHRIERLEDDLRELKTLPARMANLEAKIDILLSDRGTKG
jgi:hypothetical protein